VVLDCAHNVASARALVQTLETSFPPGCRLLIFAGSSDKDLEGMFRVLAPHFGHLYLTAYTGSRSVSPEHLAELLGRVADVPYTICPTSSAAWKTARACARTEDLICIAGSVYLAGELRPLLLEEAVQPTIGPLQVAG
jgi:dihydrofolate synthase/folylpolyglutamate synthase